MRIAIVGGGPAGLLAFKRLLESSHWLRAYGDLSVTIIESGDRLGCGMPYGPQGARLEHVTNVSGDELPSFVQSLSEWVAQQPRAKLAQYLPQIDPDGFHDKQVVPRLLFGWYLSDQFDLYINQARELGIAVDIIKQGNVEDIDIDVDQGTVSLSLKQNGSSSRIQVDRVIVCTGHSWSQSREKNVPGYFDSPYPPDKIALRTDHTVHLRGSSLTAMDALRTLMRCNGRFVDDEHTKYEVDPESPNFKIVMHSRQGLLPCVRVHMEEPHTASDPVLSARQVQDHIDANGGFLSLDYLFENGFKEPLLHSAPRAWRLISDMDLEQFVGKMMDHRQDMDAFDLMRKEYAEAEDSIEQERPVYWKELLAGLSFAMNYPAKHMSAEDMLRLKKILQPLISVVIAFVPQSSCRELLALQEAGRLTLVADGDHGKVFIEQEGHKKVIYYDWSDDDGQHHERCETFIDCTGQRPMSFDRFPFPSLIKNELVSPAYLDFASTSSARDALANGDVDPEDLVEVDGQYKMRVPGLAISDDFAIVDRQGKASDRVYIMAVPYISGYNPDYSGLDFCEKASQMIVDNIVKTSKDQACASGLARPR